ncbi:hypothetical protein [Bradyrhizobium ivorense]|nr:hypothetical protein [Bradyrhizobium ivorense]
MVVPFGDNALSLCEGKALVNFAGFDYRISAGTGVGAIFFGARE